jgi:hypothetical protein
VSNELHDFMTSTPVIETLKEFYDYADDLMELFPRWRHGQCLFNALARVDLDLADRVRGDVDLDPFHDDGKIPTFSKWLAINWR